MNIITDNWVLKHPVEITDRSRIITLFDLLDIKITNYVKSEWGFGHNINIGTLKKYKGIYNDTRYSGSMVRCFHDIYIRPCTKYTYLTPQELISELVEEANKRYTLFKTNSNGK